MELVKPYKIPKDEEIHKIPRLKGFKFLCDLSNVSRSFPLFTAYFIEILEKGTRLPYQIIRTW
jgi:hypothetical protein